MGIKLSEIKDAKTRQRIRDHLATVAPVDSGKAKGPEPVRGSKSADCGTQPAKECLGYRITLVQYRRKKLDGHDSLAFSLKPTVDRITNFLGFTDDSDPRLQWEYHQVVTQGPEGTSVKIDAL